MTKSRTAALLLAPTMLLFVLANGVLPAGADPTAALTTLQKSDHILFFGDSLTALAQGPKGYVTIVRDTLKKTHPDLEVQVSAVATGGHTVPDLLKRLDKDVLVKKPTIVVIQIGCNDARRIPKETFKSVLEERQNW